MTIVASAELLGVIPVLVGPLQALLVILPGVLVAIAGLLITLFKPSTVKRFLQLLWSQKLVVLPVLLLVVAASWIFPMLKALAIPATALREWQNSPPSSGIIGKFCGDRELRGQLPAVAR